MCPTKQIVATKGKIPLRNVPLFCVVVPAYNEDTVIGEVLKGVLEVTNIVVVIDDGSSDRTAEIALEYPVTVLRHPINLGAGAAMQTGFDFACTLPVDYVVTIDADGQHDPKEIPGLIEMCRKGCYDVVLGSRFMKGASALDIDGVRKAVLKLATIFTKIMTGLKVTDTHNSFRVFTHASAARIKMKQNGYAHSSELLSLIAKLKMKYTEAPVTVQYTEYSKRKGQTTWNLINILWDMISEKIK